ncbi:MAG: lysophospholipid acyltransferase family protein [Planctomycetales bacterium]|nr:lysophospholipid acyltransferase family protein [Planctomycetales bacterium]
MAKQRSGLGDYLAYFAVRMALAVIQSAPVELCAGCCGPIAFLAADVFRIRSDVVTGNLRQAFPDWSPRKLAATRRAMWRHLLLMVVEIAHAPRKLRLSNWRRRLKLDASRTLMRTILGERPVVFVSGHFGNFELSAHFLGLLGFHGYAVARPLDNRLLDDYVRRFREHYGQKMLPKEGSADEIQEMLSRGGTLCVLADQNAGKKGVWVDFFGRPASTHKAIALFALHHDALLLVASTTRMDRPLRYEITEEDVCDARDCPEGEDPVIYLTRRFTAALEAAVRRQPDQYWWLHRRWKGRAPQPRGVARQEAA